jgi:hypothetical protein
MRRELDQYYTPDDVARKLVAKLPRIHGRVLEPHVGGGAFARALAGHDLTCGDLDPSAPGLPLGRRAYVGEFLDYQESHDWIIGNPPYRDAEAHVRHALKLAPRVAFLLRLAFLESVKRGDLWMNHPPAHVWVLQKRPSFTGGRTDSCAYGWFYWGDWPRNQTFLGWV